MNELSDNQEDVKVQQVQTTWTTTQKLIAIVFSVVVIIAPLDSNRRVLLSYASPLVPRGSYLGNVLYEDHKYETQLPTLDLFNTVSLSDNIDPDRLDLPGVEKDGIPALTDPDFVTLNEAGFLKPGDRVIGVTVNGESRCYPIKILNYHELVNDQLGGIPVGIFFCPLCDSFSVVDRRIDGRTLEFGVSGYIYNSNVVMYDRSDNAMWPQMLLKSASGPLAGQSLKFRTNWEVTSFAQWSDGHPDSTVLSIETGHRRDYAINPYIAMLQGDDLRFNVSQSDKRLAIRDRVIGVKLGDVTRAYDIEKLRQAARQHNNDGTLTDRIGDQTIRLTFDPQSDAVRVLEAPPQAKVVHTFWFAWAAYHPQTELYGE